MGTERVRGWEAATAGDLLDRQTSGLEQAAGVLEAHLLDPLLGTAAGLCLELAGQGPLAAGGMASEVDQREHTVEVFDRPGAGRKRGWLASRWARSARADPL